MNEPIEERDEESRATVSPGYLEVVGIVLVIVLGLLFAYDRFLVPKVKVADLKSFLQEQKALFAAGAITEEQWQHNFDALEQVFKEQPQHHLIILKDVVLHHDPDTEIKLK